MPAATRRGTRAFHTRAQWGRIPPANGFRAPPQNDGHVSGYQMTCGNHKVGDKACTKEVSIRVVGSDEAARRLLGACVCGAVFSMMWRRIAVSGPFSLRTTNRDHCPPCRSLTRWRGIVRAPKRRPLFKSHPLLFRGLLVASPRVALALEISQCRKRSTTDWSSSRTKDRFLPRRCRSAGS